MMCVGRNTNRGYQTSIKPPDLHPSPSFVPPCPSRSRVHASPDARFSVFTTNRWCRVSTRAPETGNPRFTLCVRFRVHVSRGHALVCTRRDAPLASSHRFLLAGNSCLSDSRSNDRAEGRWKEEGKKGRKYRRKNEWRRGAMGELSDGRKRRSREMMR